MAARRSLTSPAAVHTSGSLICEFSCFPASFSSCLYVVAIRLPNVTVWSISCFFRA